MRKDGYCKIPSISTLPPYITFDDDETILDTA